MRSGRREARARLGIATPRMRAADLARESALSVIRFPARSLLTALGTVLAAAAFVSTLGLISTLGQQVSSSFDVRRATEVVVTSEDPGLNHHWQGREALDRVHRLSGVVAAGPRITIAERPVRRLVSFADGGPGVRIMGADPDALRVMAPDLLVGRLFTAFDEAVAARLVLLSRGVADELGINRTQAAVFIDNQAYTVAGIYDDVLRRPEALTMAIMPFSTANRLAGAESVERDILIETSPGAAQLIGHQAPLALHPAAPNALRSIAPPDPRVLRREIEANVTRSSLLISLVTLIIGTVSIGNAATASISARRSEIGLRRAIGGRPTHIFAQLICETTVLGAIGGLLGAFLGLCVTSAVSLWNAWTPILDLRLTFAAAAACTAAGLIAGLLPATRAMRVQPVTALQR